MQISARNRRRSAFAAVSFGLHLSTPASTTAGFSQLLSMLTFHRRLGTNRAPASFDSDAQPALVSPASVCIFRRTVHRATSVPESFRISRRSRFIGTSVLTLARVFAYTTQQPRPCSSFDAHDHDGCAVYTSTHVSGSRLAALPNTLTARVHIQRFVIEKVWLFRLRQNHPARAFEPSDQSFVSTELLPYSRELSSTRLAALPTQ